MNRNVPLFKEYYRLMMCAGDCDPSYAAMNYIADRLELNMSQRYWLAFLYGLTYCAPTSYYILNEFPDMENVDLGRMERWWAEKRGSLFFQTDRAKVRNFNKFVRSYESYRDLMGGLEQEAKFAEFLDIPYEDRYKAVYKFADNIYYFGRFSLFNYLEAINELTSLKMTPDTLELKKAESSRNGLCYVYGLEAQVTKHHQKPEEPINYELLESTLLGLHTQLTIDNPDIPVTYWNIETALCAYKKLFWGARYLGYYIDRMQQEIITMQDNIPEGVNWNILWDFRREFFDHSLLGEISGWVGVRKGRLNLFKDTRQFLEKGEVVNIGIGTYKQKVVLPNIGDVYR